MSSAQLCLAETIDTFYGASDKTWDSAIDVPSKNSTPVLAAN
jgi:hypothetical protein